MNYDIDEIKETIAGMPREKKLEYLYDKEDEIYEVIEELDTLLGDIKELRDEMENENQKEIRDKILKAINNAGYHLPIDDNDCLSIDFGEATILIPMGLYTPEIEFSFITDKNQLTYCNKIASLLPDYKQNGNHFSKTVTKETLVDEVVNLVRKVMETREV